MLVRALLGTLEYGYGVTPCTVIAPGLREAVQMLLEKGAPGESPRLMALLLLGVPLWTPLLSAVKRDVQGQTLVYLNRGGPCPRGLVRPAEGHPLSAAPRC